MKEKKINYSELMLAADTLKSLAELDSSICEEHFGVAKEEAIKNFITSLYKGFVKD